MSQSPASLLEWNKVCFDTDAFGRLNLRLPDGTAHTGVVPVRAFPSSDPSHWVSLCDCNGREIALLESLDLLSSEARQILQAELARREFQPVIERIVEVRSGPANIEWRVITDRGETVFTTAGEDSVRQGADGAVAITDTHGIRYRILDERNLDPATRRYLRRYL